MEVLERIRWLGHDSFLIEGDPTIYLDPFQIRRGPPADLILISHEHFDHYSPEDLAKIAGPETDIVTVPLVAGKLRGKVHSIRPGERATVRGVEVEAVPAYNVNKFRSPGVPFHPKGEPRAGFVLTVGGVRIYHAGDTDHIPEMGELTVDIALLPVSGTFVMTPEEAAQAARRIKPRIAIPMHYGSIVASEAEARRFQELLQGEIEVRILKKAA